LMSSGVKASGHSSSVDRYVSTILDNNRSIYLRRLTSKGDAGVMAFSTVSLSSMI
jgi:hypothetical protein